eukprot:m.923599 g.923599  ORF g.923599 m.923599 type:complete len:185 (-) comp23766_c1_seq16:2299-2853(-)
MMSQRLCIKTLRIASLIPALTLWCLVEYSFANFKASDLEKVPDGEALHTNNMVLLEGWHKLPPKQEIIGKPDAPPGEGPPPIMVDVDDAVQHATITVLVAAFREQKCPKTLADLFTKAKNSDRIRIGVIQQNAESDLDCTFFLRIPFCLRPQPDSLCFTRKIAVLLCSMRCVRNGAKIAWMPHN